MFNLVCGFDLEKLFWVFLNFQMEKNLYKVSHIISIELYSIACDFSSQTTTQILARVPITVTQSLINHSNKNFTKRISSSVSRVRTGGIDWRLWVLFFEKWKVISMKAMPGEQIGYNNYLTLLYTFRRKKKHTKLKGVKFINIKTFFIILSVCCLPESMNGIIV